MKTSLTFSEEELLVIQSVWERVSEDFRPFNINVTTQDPGVEALQKTAGADVAWGQRVVIGGSENDWYDPETPIDSGGVSYGSFAWGSDTPNFAFAGDYGAAPEDIAEVVSHEVGHSLGLAHDGQFRFYMNIEDPEAPELVKLYDEYYGGHGNGSTSWAPIMGVGYGRYLTQWSKAEYFNATQNSAGTGTLQDDLAIITNPDPDGNGVSYRDDDHSNSRFSASVLGQTGGPNADVSSFEDEGIIEQNTDLDYFSFVVEGLGEALSLDINPFHNGPNLDVLAKIFRFNTQTGQEVLVATSNPIDAVAAGSQTYGSGSDGGWLQTNGEYTDLLFLTPGTYYVTVEGAGRPLTYIDPAYHPGPIEGTGDPPDPPLPPDESDWGYSNYGSLGYYSIVGSRSKGLVVGVDFDGDGGNPPENWNLYAGGAPTNLTDLISETGAHVPYTLTISSTAETIESAGSDAPIDPVYLPGHVPELDGLDGYLTAEEETLTFVWGNLAPNTVYQIYVFGHADFDAENVVTVTGGFWNGQQQTYNFTQNIAADTLVVNDQAPGSEALSTYSLFVIANEAGEITINVTSTGEEGAAAAVAGLAISTTKVGSISGTKFNDANGNRVQDTGEEGLEGWVIYLDANNDGELNSTLGQTVEVVSPDSPQPLQDNSTIKSELTVEAIGHVVDIDVLIDIDHTYDSDLLIYLVSPNGTRVKLVEDTGAAQQNFTQTIFDDDAIFAIDGPNSTAPYTGRFRPMEPLSTFIGESTEGVWQLEIGDDAPGDTGTLNSWSITIKLAGAFLEPFAITDVNGNYSFTNLPPGQYVVREDFSEDQLLEGWQQTFAPAPITVRSGANVTGFDFGNWIPVDQHGSIQGQKWNDTDGDGVRDASESGIEGWIIYLDANGNGVRDIASTPTVFTSTDVPQAIEDFSSTSSQITVEGLGSVFDVNVTLNVTHSFIGDLDAFLISPSGRDR